MAGLEAITLPSPFLQPGKRQDFPGRHHPVVTASHRFPATADVSQCPATATVSSLAGAPTG